MVATDLGIIHSVGAWWKMARTKGLTGGREVTAGGAGTTTFPEIPRYVKFVWRPARHFRKNYFTLNIIREAGVDIGELI
jgi:hypothetical protein